MTTDRTRKMKTEKLERYMKLRSKVEGMKWKLDIEFLENHFTFGVRCFFGVHMDNNGNLLFDEQEPFDGFFSNYEIMMNVMV
jgi:hypothetical protein